MPLAHSQRIFLAKKQYTCFVDVCRTMMKNVLGGKIHKKATWPQHQPAQRHSFQVISLKKLGVDDIVHFDFMEPPRVPATFDEKRRPILKQVENEGISQKWIGMGEQDDVFNNIVIYWRWWHGYISQMRGQAFEPFGSSCWVPQRTQHGTNGSQADAVGWSSSVKRTKQGPMPKCHLHWDNASSSPRNQCKPIKSLKAARHLSSLFLAKSLNVDFSTCEASEMAVLNLCWGSRRRLGGGIDSYDSAVSKPTVPLTRRITCVVLTMYHI